MNVFACANSSSVSTTWSLVRIRSRRMPETVGPLNAPVWNAAISTPLRT